MRMVERPDGSVTRAADWAAAALAHVPGERDAALRRIAGWPDAAVRHLEVEVTSIRQLMRNPDLKVFRIPPDFDRTGGAEIRYSARDRALLEDTAARLVRDGVAAVDLALRGVLFHTDIAVLAEGAGRMLHYADGRRVNFDDAAADHWRAARVLADMLSAQDGRLPDLTHWARAALAWMVAVQQWNAAHVDHAVDRFGDDADVRFLAGCLHEMLASARTQAFLQGGGVPAGFQPRVGSRNAELGTALALFRRAVALNPRHTEARMHYGRMLTLTGRPEAAVPELQRATTESTDTTERYFGQLFLGAALEAAKSWAAAREAYTAAAALFPPAQAPRLALSHLLFATGQRQDAATAIAPLLAAPPDEDVRTDPWWTYLAWAGRDADARLADARRRLAARPQVP
jgi:Flp pilus assembly protein TadD